MLRSLTCVSCWLAVSLALGSAAAWRRGIKP
jgi:hypothetical protein